MDFARLEKNIIDVIKEEQAKLGYRKEFSESFLSDRWGCDRNAGEIEPVF